MIDNNTKRILGKLFKNYKDDLNIAISQIEHANISSLNTFYNACKGEIIKNDQFYIDYCNFFNHEYMRDASFELWLDNYLSRMIHAFDYYEEKYFYILHEEFIIRFKDYKEYAIYHEYYQIMQSLFNYYKNNQYLRLEDVEYYLELIDIKLFSKELDLYLLDYMFRSNWNYIGNKELPYIIVEKMKSIDKSHYLTNYQDGYLNMLDNSFIDALNCFNLSINASKDKNNKYREVQSLLAIYAIYRNIDNHKERKIASQLIECKKEIDLSNSLKHNINYSVGMQDYLEERYERGYELFNENLIKYHSYSTLLFQCSICSRLKSEYPKELFSNEIEDRYDFIYLDYFRKKHNKVDNEKLAKYVLNEIIPRKLKDEIFINPYWSLFEYEMHIMADNDIKLRKYYVNFMKELKKYCKTA